MKNENKKPSIFWTAYTVLCIVIVLLIAIATVFFYDFIDAFEQYRPENAVEAYINGLSESEISRLASDKLSDLASGYEAMNAVRDEVYKMLDGGSISYVESSNEGGVCVFDLYCRELFCSVTVTESSGGKYGFSDYTVTNTEIADEWITSRLTTVTAVIPADAELILNDWSIDGVYVVSTMDATDTVSEFELGDSFGYDLAVYEIPNVFGGVSCRALDINGEIELSNPTFGVYTSGYTPVDSLFTVVAPEGAAVTLNGITVSDSYNTGDVIAPDATPYEAQTAPKCTVYSIKGLRNTPVVTVTLDGETLSPVTADSYDAAYTYPDSYKSSYTVRLPEDLALYCNGVIVDETMIVSRDGEYSVPKAVERYVKEEKSSVEYVVDGLYGEPNFTSSDENCVTEEADGIYTFYPAPDEDEIERLYSEAQNFTELYIKYSYEGTDYTKANYDAVIAHVKNGSDAYDIIEVSYNSMIYNSNFKVDKLETEIYDMVKYADNCYGVKVDFDSHGKYYIYEKVAVGTYTMIWIVSDGEWQLAYFKFV